MKNKVNRKYILGFLLIISIHSFGQNKTTNEIMKTVNDIKNKMKSKKYELEFEKKSDINNDGINDEILLFNGNISDSDNEIETLDSPVFIVLSNSKKVLENYNLLYTFIPNNSNLDNNLVVKGNFFTIEQTTGGGNSKETKYITFKFDNNKIFLYKYGIETSFPGKTKIITSTKIYSKKDFGIIAFKDFNLNDIQNKLNK